MQDQWCWGRGGVHPKRWSTVSLWVLIPRHAAFIWSWATCPKDFSQTRTWILMRGLFFSFGWILVCFSFFVCVCLSPESQVNTEMQGQPSQCPEICFYKLYLMFWPAILIFQMIWLWLSNWRALWEISPSKRAAAAICLWAASGIPLLALSRRSLLLYWIRKKKSQVTSEILFSITNSRCWILVDI